MRIGRTVWLFIGLLVLGPAAAHAQGIGVEGGPALASFSQPGSTWASGNGVTGGLFVELRESHRLGVTVDALYAERSFSVVGSQGRLQFIEVPILARLDLAASPRHAARVYALAGTGIDLNFKAKPVGANYNAIDMNAIVGAGLEVSRLVVEARQSIGLRQLEPNTPGLTSRVFVVTLGVRLR